MDMADAIERFRQSLPESVRERLDFSPESLNVIEALVLGEYSSPEQLQKHGDVALIDGMARYVGQVFRQHFGGKWFIDYGDPKRAFYGLPQLRDMAGRRTQQCPITLVTASADRRTGKFIKTVFDGYQERAVADAQNQVFWRQNE